MCREGDGGDEHFNHPFFMLTMRRKTNVFITQNCVIDKDVPCLHNILLHDPVSCILHVYVWGT